MSARALRHRHRESLIALSHLRVRADPPFCNLLVLWMRDVQRSGCGAAAAHETSDLRGILQRERVKDESLSGVRRTAHALRTDQGRSSAMRARSQLQSQANNPI